MAGILLLNGPNLNLLGSASRRFTDLPRCQASKPSLDALARTRGHVLSSFQSNAEHELIAKIHAVKRDGMAFVIINPGAFTHTSIALRDAFLGVAVPFIEVHLSNLFAREEFRHHSYLSDIAVGCIVGLGPIGYELALIAACARLADA